MQINTRDVPRIEEIQPEPKAKSGHNEPEILVNTTYEALTKLENLVAKGNHQSILAIGISLAVGAVMVAMMMANLAKSSQSFISRSNGQTETLEFYSGSDRSDLLIKGFAGRFIQNLYSWRSTLPEPGNPPDKGMGEGKELLPSSVYKATLGMNPSFATSFRKGIAEAISLNLKDTDYQATFILHSIGTPEKLGSGSWKVKVFGYQQVLGKNKQTKPMGVELTAKAVPPPSIRASDKQYQNSLTLAAAIARAEGLEVTNLVNIKE